MLTPAWLEPENGFGPAGVQMRAEPDGDGYRLTGTKRHVAFASSATALVVLARTGERPGDIDLFVVDPGAAGGELAPAADRGVGHAVRGDLRRRAGHR